MLLISWVELGSKAISAVLKNFTFAQILRTGWWLSFFTSKFILRDTNGNLLKTLSTFLWSQTSYDVLPLQMATAIKTTSHCFKTQTLKLNIIFLIFTPCSCTDTKETMFYYLKPRGVQTVENMELNNPYSYFLWV